MAESGSSSNNGMIPPSSSAAAAPDWEVLTMSMSASSMGRPHGDELDGASERANPQIESFSNLTLNDVAFASDMWAGPLHGSVNRDSSNDAEAEPFTEGWKPHLSVSSSTLYGYVAERNREEGVLLSSETAETYFDSGNASMGIPEGLLVTEKLDGDVESRFLAYDHSADEVGIADVPLKQKNKTTGGKRPRKVSKFVWSIAVVATAMGIVFLGHRLRTAYQQNQQLQIQLSAKDEKLNDLLLQVNRLKEVLGNYQRVPVSKK